MSKVLVVENTMEHASMLVRELGAYDSEITLATTRTEAEAALAGNKYEVVVMDLMVPTQADGWAVFHSAKVNCPRVRVIIVTNYSTPELSAQAMNACAFDFLDRSSDSVDFFVMLKAKVVQALQTPNMAMGANSGD